MVKRFMLGTMCLFIVSWVSAQNFVETGNTYPVVADGNQRVVNGSMAFEGKSDEEIYTNAMLWAIENICPQLRDGITEVNIPEKHFSCDFTLGSIADSGQDNLYYLKAVFSVADGKLLYYLSDVLIESSTFILKKVTPLEKLTPEKKASHRRMMDDFVQAESLMLNKMFDFVTSNQPAPITHWSDIAIRRPVVGMNEDECRLAFGKPLTIMRNNEEVQWMYSSSFYLFFQDGLLKTFIK